MAEAPAAAVDHQDDLVFTGDAELPREILIVYVFAPGHLDLEEMVPRAEGAELVLAALPRLAGNGCGSAPATAPFSSMFSRSSRRAAVFQRPA